MNHCPHCGCPLIVADGKVTEYVEPVKEPSGCLPLLRRVLTVALVLGVVAIVTAILSRCGAI